MHMNITSVLRRTSSPTAPIVNSIAASDEVVGRRDVIAASRAALTSVAVVAGSLGSTSARRPRWPLRRASTTLPTTAITSSTAVISNGQRKSVNRLAASCLDVAVVRRRRARRVAECAPVAQSLPATSTSDARRASEHAERRSPAGRWTGAARRATRAVDAEQHDHEQEQHDDRAGVHDDLDGRDELRRPAARNSTATLTSVSSRNSAECTGLRASDDAERADEHRRRRRRRR